jgi:16S rRNA (cytosine1402-N4)-methyltransferase
VSVLLAEVLAAFEGRPVRRYVDGTLGAAGHACAVLRQHPEMQALVGFDLDPTAHQLASAKLQQCGAALVPVAVSPAGAASFDAAAAAAAAGGQQQQQPTAFLVRSNFGRMKAVLQQLPLDGDGAPAGGDGSSGGGGVDAILLDLGISSMQVGAGYGFAQPAVSDISAPGLHSTLLPRSLPSPAAP